MIQLEILQQPQLDESPTTLRAIVTLGKDTIALELVGDYEALRIKANTLLGLLRQQVNEWEIK